MSVKKVLKLTKNEKKNIKKNISEQKITKIGIHWIDLVFFAYNLLKIDYFDKLNILV